MKNSRAFSLIEVLIALSLSSFILLALTQAYRTSTKFYEKSLDLMVDNRKVCLVFNQLERDLSTAFIPTLYQEIKPTKDKKAEKTEEQPKAETPEEKKEKKKKELEKLKDFFLGAEGDGESFKFEEKRLKSFDRLTFITTNPLQVYGNNVARFVRVAYELIQDKERDRVRREFNQGTVRAGQDYVTYKLIRKESHEVEDVKMKVSQFDYAKVAQQVVREQVVAENIKSFHVEYITFKEEEPEEKKGDKEHETMAKAKGTLHKPKEELRSFTWGDKPYSHGVVPQRIEVTLVFWNKDGSDQHFFHMMVPVFSYPTEQPEEVKKALQEEQKAQDGQKGGPPAGQAGAPAAQGAGNVSIQVTVKQGGTP